MELGSMNELVERLAGAAISGPSMINDGLEEAAEFVEKTAKNEFDAHQSAIGPFQGWADLAEAGSTSDDSLLTSEELRDSIEHEVDIDTATAIVGSKSDIMLYREVGTNGMPPCPVLGPSAYRNTEKIGGILVTAAISGLFGGR